MQDDPEFERRSLPPKAAQRVLARAALLDAAPSGALSMSQLNEIAVQVGISKEAMIGALREHEAMNNRAPGWVRLCLLGVPDRAAALRYYWIFAAGLCASPLLLLLGTDPVTRGVLALGFAAFCAGALWSTSRAVRWLDQHGWQRLP